MRRFSLKFLPLITLLYLTASFLQWQGSGYWMCEGRVCGTSANTCCCISVTPDPSCADAGVSSAIDQACAGGCQCVFFESGVKHPPTPPAIAFFALQPVALPVPVFEFALPSQQALISVETRGPPLTSVSLCKPSLRAPPLA